MDFVVAGLGLGALIVVVGFVVRDLGPLLWRFVSQRSKNDDSPARALWSGLCQSISMVLTVAGVVILLATVIAVALGLTDHLGSRIVIIVSVAAILAAGVLVAFNVRDYRAEVSLLPSTESGLGRGSSREFSTSLTTSVTSNPISTVRPVRKPEGLRAESESLVETAPQSGELDPHLDEPFDATKLLASEFVHHDEAGDSATRNDLAPAEQQLIPEVVDQEEMASAISVPLEAAPIEGDGEVVSESVSAGSLQIVRPAPAEDTVVSSIFRSPLLSDIGVAAEPAVNGFESSLLADVEVSSDDHVNEFVSPLFADLAVANEDVVDDSNSEETEVENAAGAEEQVKQPAGRKR